MVIAAGTYRAKVGSQEIDLPLIPITGDLAIALLITVDHGVRFVELAATELAQLLKPYEVDLVVSVATMGIPLAIEVTQGPRPRRLPDPAEDAEAAPARCDNRAGEVHHHRCSAAPAL